jgi:hypothetical protein
VTAVAGRRASICTSHPKLAQGLTAKPGAGGASIKFGSHSTNAGPARKTLPVIGFVLSRSQLVFLWAAPTPSQFLGFGCRVSAWAATSRTGAAAEMNHWMASDLNPQEMGGFASLLRGASASPAPTSLLGLLVRSVRRRRAMFPAVASIVPRQGRIALPIRLSWNLRAEPHRTQGPVQLNSPRSP